MCVRACVRVRVGACGSRRASTYICAFSCQLAYVCIPQHKAQQICSCVRGYARLIAFIHIFKCVHTYMCMYKVYTTAWQMDRQKYTHTQTRAHIPQATQRHKGYIPDLRDAMAPLKISCNCLKSLPLRVWRQVVRVRCERSFSKMDRVTAASARI